MKRRGMGGGKGLKHNTVEELECSVCGDYCCWQHNSGMPR